MFNSYNEEKLNTEQRKNLPKKDFGILKERKFPLNDRAHVIAAIRFFSKCPEAQKKALARRIQTAARRYGIEIKKDSPIYPYLEDTIVIDGVSLDTFQEAPDNKNKKETDKQEDEDNQEVDNNNPDDPNDYSADAGADADTPAVTDDGTPDYTSEEEPDEDTAETDDNGPDNAESEPDDTNNDVKSGDTAPDDNGNAEPETDDTAEDEPEDYTSEEEPGGDSGDGAGEDDEGNTEGDSDAGDNDYGSDTDNSDTSSGADDEIQQLQNDVFSDLSEAQMKLRVNSVKDSFIDLYNNISNTAKQMIDLNRSSENIATINYLNETLFSLKNMVRDALTDSFNTKSLAENQIILQKFITIYSLILKIVERIGKKEEENKE